MKPLVEEARGGVVGVDGAVGGGGKGLGAVLVRAEAQSDAVGVVGSGVEEHGEHFWQWVLMERSG
eukprot:CAMPEP_0173389120 /NCGR_PEP_ID=MMETSP1356-20130122/11276_1 /TAXON_ID=77927 ORGANISM="Hemiselmis virescens, Strain PCC157" /NCGR_SAMPLE_ID=MMETSP1356 /ASSEMBLY_ACC=CAM_ASM_000847 /LENGTH=64 /DNA_ID=CAMNT_0014346189 /DNA_START=86 /DNA_END=276 /DNA_ORIENTATION=-